MIVLPHCHETVFVHSPRSAMSRLEAASLQASHASQNGCLQGINLFVFPCRRHSGEEAVEEEDGKKSKRHRSDKDRSSDKRDDDDRSAPRPSGCTCANFQHRAATL